MSSPISPEMTPFTGERPDNVMVTDRPNVASAKYSGAEKRRAKFGEDRCEKGQTQRREGPADAGGDRGDADGLARQPFFRHGVSVETARRRRRRPGGIDQDRGDAAPVDGPRVDPEEHDDPGDGGHAEGEGDEERDPHRGGEAGDRPDDDPEERAEHERNEVVSAQDRTETVIQQVEIDHPLLLYILSVC